jgi:large subunit ribosomal protein L23
VSSYHKTIRAPSITERNTALRTSQNKYVFTVDRRATKKDVKKAVEGVFGVKVVSVNTMVVKGKYKRTRGVAGYRPNTKKAVVKLAQGQSIDRFGEV